MLHKCIRQVMGGNLQIQCGRQNGVHMLHGDKSEGPPYCLVNLLQILLIVQREDDLLNAVAEGGHGLFFQSADGQNRRVISPVIASSRRTGTSVRAETMAVVMAIPAEGPSLGTAPSGKWT